MITLFAQENVGETCFRVPFRIQVLFTVVLCHLATTCFFKLLCKRI